MSTNCSACIIDFPPLLPLRTTTTPACSAGVGVWILGVVCHLVLFSQAGTAFIRRQVLDGRIYTELFVDEMNEFYYEGFSVYDANKKEDFPLRMKLYCTICDFPGRLHFER